MKRFFVLLIAAMMVLAMAGCTAKEEETTTTTIKIGSLQLVEHVALDEATRGFKDVIAESGMDITIDEANAQDEVSNCETISAKFVNDGVDLIFANATPAAQAAAAKTSDIPIIFVSVTDAESAGLVESNDNPGGNVSGASDLTPVAAQIDMMFELLDSTEIKTVGLFYCNGEDNSIFQIDLAKKALEAKGIAYKEFTVADVASVQSVVTSAIGQIDVAYIPTDNLLASAMPTVSEILHGAGIPVIVAEEGMCLNGGLATYGLSYYNLGRLAGEMAIEVLNGADISSMPVRYLNAEDLEMIVNQTALEQLGISVNQELLDSARKVVSE
ncbi:MAG: ABC transporter substrate-binding protein [Erysipelotrichaceae bacterium]|nr:ABC transporter substrate-binding protein [Erysipelotrichaceae bacterium]